MANASSTGATISIAVSDLGAIPNQLERINIEKLIAQEKSWAGVARRLVETKLIQQTSGNVIGRVLLMVWWEEQQAKVSNVQKPSLENTVSENANNQAPLGEQLKKPEQSGVYKASQLPKKHL